MAAKVDILIIGSGAAGEYGAGMALMYTKSVGLVEKGPVGGDCIFNACIPTKAMVQAARAYKKASKSNDFFLSRYLGRIEFPYRAFLCRFFFNCKRGEVMLAQQQLARLLHLRDIEFT